MDPVAFQADRQIMHYLLKERLRFQRAQGHVVELGRRGVAIAEILHQYRIARTCNGLRDIRSRRMKPREGAVLVPDPGPELHRTPLFGSVANGPIQAFVTRGASLLIDPVVLEI